jgi:hypothetical protein
MAVLRMTALVLLATLLETMVFEFEIKLYLVVMLLHNWVNRVETFSNF